MGHIGDWMKIRELTEHRKLVPNLPISGGGGGYTLAAPFWRRSDRCVSRFDDEKRAEHHCYL